MKAAVIGAGPAGLSAAIGLAKSGFETTVYERNKEWTGRVCGAFLSPESLEALRWLGVKKKAEELGVPALSVAVYDAGGRRTDFPVDQEGVSALALPRKDLERILSERAEEEGVKILRGVSAEARGLDCDLAVSAQGRLPPGRTQPETRKRWYGMNAEFEGAPLRSGSVSLHFFPGGYIGMLTYANGMTNVCGLVRGAFKEGGESWQDVFSRLSDKRPDLRGMLAQAKAVTPWKGVGPLPFGCYIGSGDGAAWPVGDSAAVCDPFMGEGISRALGAGPMIFGALRQAASPAKAYAEYRRLWHRSYRFRQNLGGVLRALSSRGWTASLAIALFSRKSFQRLLLSAIHS